MISTWQPPPRQKGTPGLHLYIIQSRVTGAVKIGRSSHPTKRLHELQTGSPYQLRLLATFDNKGDLELTLHQSLRKWRLRMEKGEWFHPDCLPNLPDWIYEQLPFEDRWWKE